MNDKFLSKEESIAIIKVHLECYDGNSPEASAEHLFGCLFSAKLDKFLGRLDLSKYGVNNGEN